MATPPTDPRDGVFVTTRPWGQFQQFTSGVPVTVKVMTISPGHRLSLQRHGHRGEMWQILDVPIQVTIGEQTWMAQVGEIVWVSSGTIHRIGNPGDTPGRVLEIAFGDFDEADIERLQDDYTR
ncbi:phosphomannose isomerase type II C-terminal cupin domain [Ornithinicoccus hortensis]|uniref:Mannose-6-phosphate isomerase type 2 n=1 Tax=Ornithinicoccus hortensis TaxID=82346 RepID=A0A542YM08_9MICO|nr:phosphomannose isomerase type II C-terminal cupin domain [Ornithinicoccus hortensis]TQL48994.1 mannose-6-phosphate isomerase type 2 [Ornithinicoccus hortensis]